MKRILFLVTCFSCIIASVVAFASELYVTTFIGGYEMRTNDGQNILTDYSVGFSVEDTDNVYQYQADDYTSSYGGFVDGYNGSLYKTTTYVTSQKYILSDVLEGGDKVTLDLYFLERTLGVNNYKTDLREEETITYVLYYADGTLEYFAQPVSTKIYDSSTVYPSYRSEKQFTIDLRIPSDKDVVAIGSIQSISVIADSGYEYNYNYSFKFGDLQYSVSSEDSKQKGILNGIMSIIDAIVELPSTIASAIKGFFDTLGDRFASMITALMTAVRSYFDDLKNFLVCLFIPDNEYLDLYGEQWSDLMRERFGALYQCYDLLVSVCERFIAEPVDSVTFPEFRYTFSGSEFVFGGWAVPLIPDGFDFLVESLKSVVDMLAVVALINALRNRYERLTDGN